MSMATEDYPLFPPNQEYIVLAFDPIDPYPLIPKFFSTRLDKDIRQVCDFVDRDGHILKVGVDKTDFFWQFRVGWVEIGQLYDIATRGWVVLRYKRDSTFEMRVFDQWWIEVCRGCVRQNYEVYVGEPIYTFLYFTFDLPKDTVRFPSFFTPAYSEEAHDPSGTFYGVDTFKYVDKEGVWKVEFGAGFKTIADICKMIHGGLMLARTALRHQPPSIYLMFEHYFGKHIELYRSGHAGTPWDTFFRGGWASFYRSHGLLHGTVLFFGMNEGDNDKVFMRILART